MALDINDKDFDSEVLQSSTPVLVDFWAEWCGPCKQLSPIIDELSTELKDSIKIVKINIDNNMDTPQKLGVRAIPTLMIFQDGKHIASKFGALQKTALTDWIKTVITTK